MALLREQLPIALPAVMFTLLSEGSIAMLDVRILQELTIALCW